VTSAAVDVLVQTGLDQLAAGNRKAARGTFANVLALDPDNTLGHYNLGVIEQQTGDEVAAMASYDAALATTPDHVPSLFNKAILTEELDLPGAVELYRTVVEIDDQRAAAFMRLGFALVHLGERQDGEAALEEGLRLDPSMARVEAPTYD
jgi:Tfp pilus assembly protein PilF